MTCHRLCMFLAAVSVWSVGISTAGRVPVEWVLTLDGSRTEMLTGLLYKIHHVELNGTVTYLKSDNVTSNVGEKRDNILVVRNVNHKSGREYLTGGRLEQSTFFTFQKHSEHYYKLIHIELKNPVTYKPSNLMPKNKVGLQDDTLIVNDSRPFGRINQKDRLNDDNSTLFGILKYQDGYKLFHKELNAPVTYDPAENSVKNVDGSQDNWLVIRSNQSWGNNYKPGGVWEKSTEFRFPQVRFHLRATISNFTYKTEALQQELAKDNPGVSSSLLNFTNERFDSIITYPVNKTKHLHNSVTFTFRNSKETRFLHQNVDAVISASLQFIPNIMGAMKFATWNTTNFPLISKKVVQTDISELRVLVTIEILPRERAEIRALWIPIDVLIPFEASATVTAVADQVNEDGTVDASIPVDVYAVAGLLRAQGIKKGYDNPRGDVKLPLSGIVRVKRAINPFATAVYHKIS